jgi:uncharacterized protein (DUF1810 family)
MTQGLNRFLAAQDRGGTYAAALAELRSGRKRSHWMWFVFPQVAGLGRSDIARFYALSGLHEARTYLEHLVLGPWLMDCAKALVSLPDSDPVAVLGTTDAPEAALIHDRKGSQSQPPAVRLPLHMSKTWRLLRTLRVCTPILTPGTRRLHGTTDPNHAVGHVMEVDTDFVVTERCVDGPRWAQGHHESGED